MYEHLVTSIDAEVDDSAVDLKFRTVDGEDSRVTLPLQAVGALEIWLDQVRRQTIRDRRDELAALTGRMKNGRRVYRLE